MPHEIKVDALGNVLARCGSPDPKAFKVMVAAHMDEVGFILVEADEGGFYHFRTVGGVDIRQVPGKPVWIGAKHTPGIIGAKPIHLQETEDRKHAISLESMRIDTGGENGAGLSPATGLFLQPPTSAQGGLSSPKRWITVWGLPH